MRVLVVEDERLLADTITAGLRNRAIAVDVAYDGDAALERLAVNDYDVIVLDRDLPVVSGDDVCRTLVESGAETRILMLTAATAVKERVAGLGLGAHLRTVTRDGEHIPLSRKEFAVLAELLRAHGGVVSAEQLLEKAWDEHIDPFTGVVRFTIMMVRRKLGEPWVIETVPGAGYRIP